jgi:hypothetical protein
METINLAYAARFRSVKDTKPRVMWIVNSHATEAMIQSFDRIRTNRINLFRVCRMG